MKKLLLLVVLLASAPWINAQQERAITTAVPFLTIAADARASGMGEMGVATSFDVYSQQWNPAKYAFADRKMGIGASYTPYLESIVNDVSLLNANFYNKLNDRSAFAFGLRYFGLGDIELRQTINDPGTLVTPNEFVLEGSYSLKLSQSFAMAVGGRFISSDLKLQDGTQDSRAGTSFGVDIAGFYRSPEIAYNNYNGRWRFGFNISNLGGKIQYDPNSPGDFLPTNLKIGGGFDFIFDQDNILAINTEFNKLLVPTPRDFNGDGVIGTDDNNEYQSISFFNGVFESFGDAPDGFSEELKEVAWALGAEYRFREAFMLRSGYFNESEEKGSRKFFTLGAGFKFNSTQIDLSYLFSTSQIRNPLENTLRFSLSFDIGEEFFND
ncbi:MAG: type IX secretion system outer membrane channel protein PorV [Muricauda sp.]|nr:type IX secretion system outer membrane channel protein PorV [Allomuricauda sp.]MBO6532753.1 type IX secretion system outer membrane channel protein PorV [Allomuricauda sp.]MBO6588367.1 type IX secretion system outer membrane channel protein PorV [Allomuricauda sp.]MBO6618493.1 type IX secretion system outer membrane channel protein PorV [Allomuricauda sp.]MBO6643905.1 type IX secretion system outer membrane channel protein PorV [Allomuricauda sp.]MBO6746789.1 type IX secretion system outer